MPKIVLVIGTPGAGKTTIMNGVTESKSIKSYKVVNMGTEMLKRINKHMERDSIRSKLSSAEIMKIRAGVLESINRMKGNIAIDTHASVKTANKIIPGFSFAELAKLDKVVSILYIDAPAREIYARRLNDNSRKRERESLSEIRLHQEINFSFAIAYSAALNVPMYILENRQDMVSKAIKEASDILKASFGE